MRFAVDIIYLNFLKVGFRMANFCTNCGTPVKEGSAFCSNCGAAIKKSVVEDTPISENNTEPKENLSEETTPIEEIKDENSISKVTKKATDKKKIIITAGAIIVGCLLAVVLFFSRSEKPETVAKKYFEANCFRDIKTMAKYTPGDWTYNKIKKLAVESAKAEFSDEYDYMEELYEEYGTTDLNKVFDKNIKEAKAEILSDLEEEYGRGYKLSFNTKSVRYLTPEDAVDEIEDFNDMIEDCFDEVFGGSVKAYKMLGKAIINPNLVKQVCVVNVESRITGSLGSDVDEDEIILVKIGSKWKAIDGEVFDYIF